jgi:sortase A
MVPNTKPSSSFRYPRAARKRRRAAAWIESFLWMIGCAALGYCAFIWGRAQYDQAEGNRMVDRGQFEVQRQPADHPQADHTQADHPQSDVQVRPPVGSLVGRIEIPRLKLSAVIFEGTDDVTLDRGVGHLAGTATPGESGNLVLAGHRDTFFRPLKKIREGDEIDVTGPEGVSRYKVEFTQIVGPKATEVLRSTGGATLTLITCYPFRYIGNAPDRFIVRGQKVDKEAGNHENVSVSGSQSGARRRRL